MATRSRIAMTQPDGKIRSIYCHNDGYCEAVGGELLNQHNTVEKVTELMDLGDISCLEKHLKPLDKAPKAFHYGSGEPPTITAGQHSFDNAQKDVTVAYHRDRGGELQQRVHETQKELKEFFESYNYLWKDGKWFVNDNSGEWIELTADIVKNDLPE